MWRGSDELVVEAPWAGKTMRAPLNLGGRDMVMVLM